LPPYSFRWYTGFHRFSFAALRVEQEFLNPLPAGPGDFFKADELVFDVSPTINSGARGPIFLVPNMGTVANNDRQVNLRRGHCKDLPAAVKT
jgi:hypothetical protein